MLTWEHSGIGKYTSMYSLSLTLSTDAEYVSMALNESFDSRGRKIIKTTRPYYRLAQGYNYCLVMGLESGTRAFFCVKGKFGLKPRLFQFLLCI